MAADHLDRLLAAYKAEPDVLNLAALTDALGAYYRDVGAPQRDHEAEALAAVNNLIENVCDSLPTDETLTSLAVAREAVTTLRTHAEEIEKVLGQLEGRRP